MGLYLKTAAISFLFFIGSNTFAWESMRTMMIEEIRKDVERTVHFLGKSELDSQVMDAMKNVPRHEFVPLANRSFSYFNNPLPIGYGQTISQPYIVAIMTDLLSPEPHHSILEIGTGSGYQAAVLAELVDQVFSIEIIPELYEGAKEVLKRLAVDNVELKLGDGYYGWEEKAPFDGIILTAVSGQIPPPLLAQLKPGGRMILPIGETHSAQHLVLVEKGGNGELNTRQILPVRFVPLTGAH